MRLNILYYFKDKKLALEAPKSPESSDEYKDLVGFSS